MMATEILSPPAPHTFAEKVLPDAIRANAGYVSGLNKLGWLRPTLADTPISEMRARLDQDDYLYIKGLLPREAVLSMRAHYFSHYAGTDLLAPNTDPVDGIYNPTEDASNHKGIGGGNPDGEELKRLLAAHKTPQYLNFVAQPELRKLVRDLMGWDSEVLLQRTMLRHNVPGGESTGVHYDKLFLRDGDAFFLTAWVPIGDIRCDGGGLIYLQDSVRLGQAIEDDFTRRAESFTPQEKISAFNQNMTDIGILSNHPMQFEEEHRHIAEAAGMKGRSYRWLIADYEAGDVVFHHPCSVHTSCTNEDPEGRIRLSTDLRFYDKRSFDEDAAVKADRRWMKLWEPGDRL